MDSVFWRKSYFPDCKRKPRRYLPMLNRQAQRVARFLLVHHTKTGKSIPIDHKIFHMGIRGRTTYQTAIKYTIFTLSDPPKYAQVGVIGVIIYHLASMVLITSLSHRYQLMVLENQSWAN
jgi:hypothetical protein